jgi:hypothetical protein
VSYDAGGLRRPRWVIPVVSVLTVCGLGLSGLSVWGIWQVPQRASATTALPGLAGRPRAALSVEASETAILQRRGHAVMTRDQTEFLADLDPTNVTLRAQQTLIFRGLVKLTFARFGYAIASDATLPQSAASTYGVPALVTAVVATHELAGYDTGAVAEGESVTFVRRDGRWWIGSDRDADADLPAAGHAEPWDDGEIGVAHGKHSLVIGPADHQTTLDRVAVALDKAVSADLEFWPTGGRHQWAGKVVVYVPEAEREFTSLFAGTAETADGVVAVTIPVLDKVDFEKGGRAYGQVGGTRVIINPTYFKPSSSFFNVVLRHEVSHVAAQPITADGTPTWLIEGLAEYVGWRQPDPARTFFVRGVDARTATAINDRTYRLTLPASRTFYLGSSATIEQRYTAGFLVCAYIQHRYGEARLKEFATQMGAATTQAKEPAVLAAALHKALGIDQDQLVSGVDSWLRQYRIGH